MGNQVKEKENWRRQGRKSCHSFQITTSLQPLQVSEHAWWRLAVCTRVGTSPGVTSSIFTEVSKCRDIQRTATVLCNLYCAILGLGMTADCTHQASMSLLHSLSSSLWQVFLNCLTWKEMELFWTKRSVCMGSVCLYLYISLPHLLILAFQHIKL